MSGTSRCRQDRSRPTAEDPLEARPLPPPPFPPALGDRRLFPDLQPRVYLNHAAISPPSLHVRAAVQAVTEDYARLGSAAFLPWIGQRERLRALLARLFGGAPKGWVLSGGTTRGLLDLALCLRWRPGDRIVAFEGEFPANVTPWQRAASSFDLKLHMLSLDGFVDGSGEGLQALELVLKEGVRLVAVSAVQFQTGLRMPLQQMSRLCHAHGALLCVDAIQAAGAVPLNVEDEGIDLLASGTHKWAMGMDGAGFLHVSPRGLAALEPRVAGWLSHEEGLRFLFEGQGHLRYDRPIRQRADFLEVGAWNTMGFAALEAGLSLIGELGIDNIHQHANTILDLLEPALVERGFRSLRSRDADGRSCILSLLPPADLAITALERALVEQGLAISIPDGRLRLSPHWPNGVEQVPEVIEMLDAALLPLRR